MRKISPATPMLVIAVLLMAALACGPLQVGVESTPVAGSGQSTAAVPGPGATDSQVPPTQPAAPTALPDGASTPLPQPPGDGRLSVVYVKDSNVWLWVEGETPRALTSSGQVNDVRLSDDGQIIAFLRRVSDFDAEVWAVNRDGSGERSLVSASFLQSLDPEQRDPNSRSLNPFHFEWVPNTHTLAFNTFQVYEGPGLGNFDDLRLVDADTGQVSTLLPAGAGGDFHYSPDGRQVAIVTPDKISLVAADGSNRRDSLITFERVITYSEYFFYPRPAWSADSTSLRVAIPPKDPMAVPIGPTRLYQIPTDGSAAVELGSVQATFFGSVDLPFSPDLARILYLHPVGEAAENRYEIHIANSDGSGDQVFLAEQYLQVVGWTADPSRFLFGRGQSQEAQLGTVGDGFVPLTANPTGIFQVRWVDAQQFLYLRDNAAVVELYLETLDGQSTLIDTVASQPPAFDFDR